MVGFGVVVLVGGGGGGGLVPAGAVLAQALCRDLGPAAVHREREPTPLLGAQMHDVRAQQDGGAAGAQRKPSPPTAATTAPSVKARKRTTVVRLRRARTWERWARRALSASAAPVRGRRWAGGRGRGALTGPAVVRLAIRGLTVVRLAVG